MTQRLAPRVSFRGQKDFDEQTYQRLKNIIFRASDLLGVTIDRTENENNIVSIGWFLKSFNERSDGHKLQLSVDSNKDCNYRIFLMTRLGSLDNVCDISLGKFLKGKNELDLDPEGDRFRHVIARYLYSLCGNNGIPFIENTRYYELIETIYEDEVYSIEHSNSHNGRTLEELDCDFAPYVESLSDPLRECVNELEEEIKARPFTFGELEELLKTYNPTEGEKKLCELIMDNREFLNPDSPLIASGGLLNENDYENCYVYLEDLVVMSLGDDDLLQMYIDQLNADYQCSGISEEIMSVMELTEQTQEITIDDQPLRCMKYIMNLYDAILKC